ncbi:MAG: hypothetical protein ACLFOY_17900 [Desulfatibacillaceae bacterium]
MKSILLATENPVPGVDTLRFAMSLARRMQSRLLVLQVLPGPVSGRLKSIVQGISNSRSRFGDAMAAAAFCEANEHEAAGRLLALLEQAARNVDQDPAATPGRVSWDVEIRQGDLAREAPRFVEEHNEIVLAVCDEKEGTGGSACQSALLRGLSIPVVSVDGKAVR